MAAEPITKRIIRALEENPGKPMTRTQIADHLGMESDAIRDSLHSMVRGDRVMAKTIKGQRSGDMATYCLYSDIAAREELFGNKVTPRAERQSVFSSPVWVPPAVPYRRPTYDAKDCIIREHLTKERLA